MKALIILLLTLTTSHAMVRGRDYMKEKVCHEFNFQGKENFRAGVIMTSSQKYSNATFEEILNIVNEIVAIAEKCCPKEADPDCYEIESLALSAKTCSDPSLYPKHLGIEACCEEQGLERKLCLAALKHPPKEFPTYVEPSDTEACVAYRDDPEGFMHRYIYGYSTDNSNAPPMVLGASIRSYLAMFLWCCGPEQSAGCFLKKRLDRKSSAMLTHVSHKACSHHALLGKDRTKLSYVIRFAQKSPNASFEDVSSLAQDASEMLSRSCNATDRDDFESEVRAHTTKICHKLSNKDQRFKECCRGEDEIKNYFCIYSLPWAKSPNLPDFPVPTNEDLCSGNRKELQEAHAYELARRYTRVPEVLLTSFYEASDPVVDHCCNETDPQACLAVKRPPLKEQLFSLLSKGNELCGEYTDHTFLEFKKRLRETYHKALPKATEEVLDGLVEQKASFASTCCLLNAPPTYCGLKVKSEVGHTCSQDLCLLH